MKKIFIIGTGAQGSIIARRLDEEPNVSEVICADYNLKTAQRLEQTLKKAKAVKADANHIEEIMKAAKGAELIVNALPPEFNPNIMEAALRGEMNYQDLASGPASDVGFVDAVKRQLALDEKFKKAGLSALINAGSAPGLTNLLARNSADKLDSCDRIEIMIYDGVWTNKFIPFWWSPETAFGDMANNPIIFENGEYKSVKPFNNPVMVDFRGLGSRRMVDHEHEEPITFGIYFRGLKYAGLKYGGPALELAESFYKIGLLGKKPIEISGTKVVPLDLVLKLTPSAPSSPDEIKVALAEGMALEEGATVVRVEGLKDGRKVRFNNYIKAPGLTEAFRKHGMSHESFLTGQSAFLFTKLFIRDKVHIKGVFPPEVLDAEIRSFYLQEASKLNITVDEIVETRLF